ncbi:MAG: hypothetical protein Q9162_002137 [Coniocarpon cinnabarinum]
MAATDASFSSDSWSESGTSPSVTPSIGLTAVSDLGRRVSAGSSATSNSALSQNGQPGDLPVGKRRGFNRPQGTAFADSARNRDSVMSLGTISHLQHWFARTGLLDGKGAQLAREDPFKKEPGSRTVSGSSYTPTSEPSFMDGSFMSSLSKLEIPNGTSAIDDCSFVSSPDQASFDGSLDEPNSFVLPPTVSTYKQKSTYVPPPPNLNVLRRELREALEDAKKLLVDYQAEKSELQALEGELVTGTDSSPGKQDSMQGWYEIQGLQVLDLTTLAIRAAKNFYTAHERTQRLYSIKSERRIRSELFNVMDVLKKMTARNFAGGMKRQEIDYISTWAQGIEDLVTKDEELEKQEQEHMQQSQWQQGDWVGRDREREYQFLKSFDAEPETLPAWSTPEDNLPTPFLSALRDGRRLIKLHNELVRRSRRQFEEITRFHSDVEKPYRCAENLRYWVKAAQLRWDCSLFIDVPKIVSGSDASAWRAFDEALLKWCRTVREEITTEWEEHQEAQKVERPILRMDPEHKQDGLSAVPW